MTPDEIIYAPIERHDQDKDHPGHQWIIKPDEDAKCCKCGISLADYMIDETPCPV